MGKKIHHRNKTTQAIKSAVPKVYTAVGLTAPPVSLTAAECMFIAQTPVTPNGNGITDTTALLTKHQGKLTGVNFHVREPKKAAHDGQATVIASTVGVLGYKANYALNKVLYHTVIEKIATAAVQNCVAVAMRRHEEVRLNAAEVCKALGEHLKLTIEAPNKAKPTATYLSKLYELLPSKKQQAAAKKIVGYNVGIAKRRLARYIKGDPTAFTHS